MLTYGLPHESRVARELGAWKPGDPIPLAPAWSNVEELLAGVVDELRASRYLFVRAHTKKGHHVAEPKPIRRPDRTGRHHRKEPTTAEELAAVIRGGRGVVRYTPKNGTGS